MSNRPFQKLSDRRAGSPVDETFYDGMPPHLVMPLQEWIRGLKLADEFARFLCLRLRIRSITSKYRLTIEAQRGETLLDIVDAILQTHSGWSIGQHQGWWFNQLEKLDLYLADGGSVFRVDRLNRCLVGRIDESVQDSADKVIAAASSSVADHLKAAWVAAYGRGPDPDKVFSEAIRAVEEVACPLVEQKKALANKATLGTVIGALRTTKPKWRILLPDKDGNPQSADVIVSMMETLWQGQVSRHGGGPKSRRHTAEEANAALHLAILLVHWMQSGVLERVP